MNNQIFGILTITLCSIGYYYSWKYQARDNLRIAVLLLIVCGLTLRIYSSTDFFLHTWDERYHALVAKNLIYHPLTPTLYDNPILPYDYKNWSGNHVWLAKPPVPLWLMSVSIYFFGNNEFAVRFTSLIVSVLSILLTYKIAITLFNSKVAWLAAFLHSIHGMLIEIGAGRISSDHIETFFVFSVELSIWMGILSVIKTRRKTLYLICCGLFTGMAFLSKLIPAFIVLPIWLSFAIHNSKESVVKIFVHFIVLSLTALIVSSSWIVYILNAFPLEGQEFVSSLTNPLVKVIQEHNGPPWFYLNTIRIVFGEIIYIPIIWLLYKSYKEFKKAEYLSLVLWIMIPMIVFSLGATKRHTYLLIAAPAIFMVTAVFWYWLYGFKKNAKYKWLYNVILVLLISLPIRYSIERMKPFEKLNRSPQWVADLKKLNDRKLIKSVLFNYDKPIEAMFYTNMTVYPNIPDKKVITDLVAQGYVVLINDNGNIPVDIKAMAGVTTEQF